MNADKTVNSDKTNNSDKLRINVLAPSKGSRKVGKRLGRGNASGQGRTGGKGEKGQKARSGGHVRPGFEGGQMPLYRRLPKIGFRSELKYTGKNRYQVVNLSVLETFDAGSVVDIAALKAKGIESDTRHKAGIKVLGVGDITKKLTVKVNAISEKAKNLIEKAGGSVELV